ncbi:MAG: PHP domain-containing protein [Propionibacteriaceae bacterium]|jgi:predicted metal-dependent phosphoesterase TrpH|nr:PHP domain-containing protein [Propionibacteriaceae bacterium]
MRAIDLHVHSNVSDGTDTPGALAALAAAKGLRAFALTDHDSFDGLDEARKVAELAGVGFLPGVEMTTDFREVGVHLLGYNCHPDDEALLHAFEYNIRQKNGRMPKLLAKLAALGMELSEAEVRAFAPAHAAIQRPHVADAMVAKGYVARRDEAFEKYIGEGRPAYVGHAATALATAIGLVFEAGGVPVLAHPWARQSRDVLTAEVIASLVPFGLAGLEIDHPDHDGPTRAELRALAGELGLFATGGSDYHGAGKVGHGLGTESTAFEVYSGTLLGV